MIDSTSKLREKQTVVAIISFWIEILIKFEDLIII